MMNDGLPFVSNDTVDYLKEVYTTDSLLSVSETTGCNNDELIGFMKGVTEVISVLDSLAKRKDGD